MVVLNHNCLISKRLEEENWLEEGKMQNSSMDIIHQWVLMLGVAEIKIELY